VNCAWGGVGSLAAKALARRPRRAGPRGPALVDTERDSTVVTVSVCGDRSSTKPGPWATHGLLNGHTGYSTAIQVTQQPHRLLNGLIDSGSLGGSQSVPHC